MKKRRATDKPTFYARYDENGKITGLYNTFTHDVIPEPNIQLTEGLKNQIVRTPSAYTVDVKSKQIVRRQQKATVDRSVSEVRAVEGRGVEHNGNYFPATAEASAYLTQCLVLSLVEERTFQVPAYKNGEVFMCEVDSSELHDIVRKVNEVRKTVLSAKLLKEPS